MCVCRFCKMENFRRDIEDNNQVVVHEFRKSGYKTENHNLKSDSTVSFCPHKMGYSLEPTVNYTMHTRIFHLTDVLSLFML